MDNALEYVFYHPGYRLALEMAPTFGETTIQINGRDSLSFASIDLLGNLSKLSSGAQEHLPVVNNVALRFLIQRVSLWEMRDVSGAFVHTSTTSSGNYRYSFTGSDLDASIPYASKLQIISASYDGSEAIYWNKW